ncbi:DUF6049 family protein [Propioniciclava flava]
MTANRPGPPRRRFFGALMGLVLLVTTVVLGPTTAQAAEPLTSVSLTQAELIDGKLRLAGNLTNTGTVSLRSLSVQLWRSRAPLASREAVTKALTEKTTTDGQLSRVPSATLALTTGNATLDPGQSSTFAVEATPAELGLAPAASYWVGVNVTARLVNEPALRTLATPRTLATVPSGTIPIASVVELSSRPHQIKQNLFPDESLAEELSTGRLHTLLTAALTRATDWYIDPSLLVEVRDMADGYRVGPDRVEGTGAAAAQAWLDQFATLDPARGISGLFGTPDLSSADASPFPELQADAVTAGNDVDARASDSGLLLVSPDETTLRDVAGLGRTVFALGIRPPQTVNATSGVTVAEVDQPTFAPSALLPDTPLNRRNTLAAVAQATGGQIRWIRTEADLGADVDPPRAFPRAPVSSVLSAAPGAWTPSNQARTGVVTPDVRATLTRLGQELRAYGAMSPTSKIGDIADAQVARGASLWWSDDAARQEAWFAAIEERIASTGGAPVSLDAIPRFSMTGATSDFPVTVTNHLTDPATVRVVVSTDNPQRIRFAEPDPVTVNPGASNTVTLAASASGAGVVTARVHLESLTGEQLTPDTTITVDTSDVGTIGWVLVIVSGVVLVLTTALRIRQVRARQKALSDG